MGRLRTPNEKGDAKVTWDPDVTAEVSAARKTYDDLKDKGYMAYSVKRRNGKKNEIIDAFDPHAEMIIMALPMAGG